MLVWGGYRSGSALATGGAYDPAGDSWTPLSQVSQPSARFDHTAVWTGSEMLVWGGRTGYSGTKLGDGARYNPLLDRWQPMQSAGAPSARYGHSAVWTGTEMIIWGGDSVTGIVQDGARYNPQTDSWSPISRLGAPSERVGHVAVWTGTEMIIWSDRYGSTNTGGRYDPTTDSWTPTDDLCAPTGRWHAPAVWTGSKMAVWGGEKVSTVLNDGYEYDPVYDSWRQITTDNAPTARARHTAVWTGSKVVIWGGGDGGVLQDGGILTP